MSMIVTCKRLNKNPWCSEIQHELNRKLAAKVKEGEMFVAEFKDGFAVGVNRGIDGDGAKISWQDYCVLGTPSLGTKMGRIDIYKTREEAEKMIEKIKEAQKAIAALNRRVEK
jgi:hypothetical protein